MFIIIKIFLISDQIFLLSTKKFKKSIKEKEDFVITGYYC